MKKQSIILAIGIMLSCLSLCAIYEAETIAAMKANQWDKVKEYLTKGANPDAVDERGYTQLAHIAAAGKDLHATKLLVEYGANPNAPHTTGTPLMHAKAISERIGGTAIAIHNYLLLVSGFLAAIAADNVAEFLKGKTSEQLQDLFNIAITKYQQALKGFHAFNPNTYSWDSIIPQIFDKMGTLTESDFRYILGIAQRPGENIPEARKKFFDNLRQAYMTAKSKKDQDFMKAFLGYLGDAGIFGADMPFSLRSLFNEYGFHVPQQQQPVGIH
jgi:ankyrin repeat protein